MGEKGKNIKDRFLESGQDDKTRKKNHGRQENAVGYERKACGGGAWEIPS